MHRIGDLRKYSRRWKIGDKARWLLEIRTDGDNATLDEIDEPLDRLQSRIRQLDFRELTLTKYKKTLLSNYVSEANFDIGMSEKHRMGASVFEFVSGNLDAIAEGLEDIVVERSEPHSLVVNSSPISQKPRHLLSAKVFHWWLNPQAAVAAWACK